MEQAPLVRRSDAQKTKRPLPALLRCKSDREGGPYGLPALPAFAERQYSCRLESRTTFRHSSSRDRAQLPPPGGAPNFSMRVTEFQWTEPT